jgi:hypothetical protein
VCFYTEDASRLRYTPRQLVPVPVHGNLFSGRNDLMSIMSEKTHSWIQNYKTIKVSSFKVGRMSLNLRIHIYIHTDVCACMYIWIMCIIYEYMYVSMYTLCVYVCIYVCVYVCIRMYGKGKAVPLQAWNGPEGSRKLKFPDFLTTAQYGGKVVSLTHRPPLPPGNTPGTHFC